MRWVTYLFINLLYFTCSIFREISVCAVDTAVQSPISKRRKTEIQFYNYTTPGVSAYLARQGKPTRVVASPVSVISSPVQSRTHSLCSSSLSSPKSVNSQQKYPQIISINKQQKHQLHTNILGNPQKMNVSTNIINKHPSNTVQRTSSEQIILPNSRVLQWKNVVYVKKPDLGIKPKQLTKLEENKLKLAIQKIQCQKEQFQCNDELNTKIKKCEVTKIQSNINPSMYHIVQYVNQASESSTSSEPIDLSVKKKEQSEPLQKLQALVEKAGPFAVAVPEKKEPTSPTTTPTEKQINIPLLLDIKKEVDDVNH